MMLKRRSAASSGLIARQGGVTLVEVIVVMTISTVLILIAALGIGSFFRKYRELSAWAELQKDAIECLNLIKNGVPVGSGNDMEYYGVANALQLRLTNTTTNTGSGIRITPPTSQGLDTPDFAHFYLYDGVVRCTYVHRGIQVASPLYVFPKQEDLEKVIVDKFKITKVNQERDVIAVQVDLHARIKTGSNSTRAIQFSTKMTKKKSD